MPDKGWQRRFDEPIPLQKGKKLVTLRDAAEYITKLPKAEHDAEEWLAVMKALLLVAESDGPTMFARIGAEPSRRAGVQAVAEGQALGSAETWQGSDEGRARNHRRAQPDGLEHRRSWVFITDGPRSLG